MQFRDRGASIQVVRTRYNPETKRGDSEVVGRLDRSRPDLDDALRDRLTTAEVQEVERFIAHRTGVVRIDLDHAALHFCRTLEQVSEWLDTAEPLQVQRFVVAVERPLTRLRKQMAKTEAPSSGARRRRRVEHRSRGASPDDGG